MAPGRTSHSNFCIVFSIQTEAGLFSPGPLFHSMYLPLV
jgi:hypothetical protein